MLGTHTAERGSGICLPSLKWQFLQGRKMEKSGTVKLGTGLRVFVEGHLLPQRKVAIAVEEEVGADGATPGGSI